MKIIDTFSHRQMVKRLIQVVTALHLKPFTGHNRTHCHVFAVKSLVVEKVTIH